MNSLRARSSCAEADAHALERARELAELVVAGVDDRLVEAAAGDPLGGALEPADPPGDASTRPRSRRTTANEQPDQAGDEQPPLDRASRLESGSASESLSRITTPVVLERDRHLRELAAARARRCRARGARPRRAAARSDCARRRATRSGSSRPKMNGLALRASSRSTTRAWNDRRRLLRELLLAAGLVLVLVRRAPRSGRPPRAGRASRRPAPPRATARRSGRRPPSAPATTRSSASARRKPDAADPGAAPGHSALPEAVADAAHGQDQLRLVRILLDLLAQVADVHVDRARLAVVGAAAEALEQLPAREDAARARRRARAAARTRRTSAAPPRRAPRPCAAGTSIGSSPASITSSSRRSPGRGAAARRSSARTRLRNSRIENGFVM